MNLRRVLIKGGTVISVDPEIGDLPKGDVLFEKAGVRVGTG